MSDFRLDRIGAAERGENPTVMAKLESGFAVIGDTQFLPGYCVLLASPRVSTLNELAPDRRRRFLYEMSLIGEAIEQVCANDGLLRVNYEILGNTDAFLHAHVFPRYAWEPPERRSHPVWLYPADRWTSPEFQYDETKHGDLRARITQALIDLTRHRTNE